MLRLTGCDPLQNDTLLAPRVQSPSTAMRGRIVWMIAGIVSLSAAAVLADFGDDRRIAAEVDRDPLVRVCGDCLSANNGRFAGRVLVAAAGDYSEIAWGH